MKKKNIKNSIVALVGIFSMSLASHVSALTLAIGDSRDLGLIDPNHPADPTSSEGYVDILTAQALNSGPTMVGANNYTRTGNDPLSGVYPAADFNDNDIYTTQTTIDLGTGYLYLLAKYDGPNYGSVVWYVGGLTGEITIPGFPPGDKDQYGISHTYLFNPSETPPPSVPDGGSALLLLGGAFAGLGFLRRKLS